MKVILKYYIIISVLFLCYSCYYAGSYASAERYKFNISKEELISKIHEFKELNPQYKVFQKNEKRELYDPDDCDSTFCSFYFYFVDIKATIHCVINVSKTAPPGPPAILKLSGVTYSSNFGNWKRINTENIEKTENTMIKQKFETEILDYLGKWERD